MEIGPELCLWQNSGGLYAAPSEHDNEKTDFSSFFNFTKQRPKSFFTSQLSGIVLELESDSEGEGHGHKWDYLSMPEGDLRTEELYLPVNRENMNMEPLISTKVLTDEVPGSSKSVCSMPSSISEHRDSPFEQGQAVPPNDVRTSGLLNQAINMTTSTKESIIIDQNSISPDKCSTPFQIPSSHDVLKDNVVQQKPNFQGHRRRSVSVGNEAIPLKAIPGAVNCPKCNRWFVDKRSMNIHGTKAHSPKKTPPNLGKLAKSNSSEVDISAAEKCRLTPVNEIISSGDQYRPSDSLLLPTSPVNGFTSRDTEWHDTSSTVSPGSDTSFQVSSNEHQPNKRMTYAVSPTLSNDAALKSLKLRLVSVGIPKHSKSVSIESSDQFTASDSALSTTKEVHVNFDGNLKSDEPLLTNKINEMTEELWNSTQRNSYLDGDGLRLESNRPIDSSVSRSQTDTTCSLTFQDFSGPLKPDMISKPGRPTVVGNPSSKLLSVKPTMDTSLLTSDGLYKCRLCKRLFPNRFSLTGHYKSHYVASQKPYCCDDCGQRYTSPSNLHYHRSRNCPVLKLKAISENHEIPTSPQSLKTIQNKVRRAFERRKVVRYTKPDELKQEGCQVPKAHFPFMEQGLRPNERHATETIPPLTPGTSNDWIYPSSDVITSNRIHLGKSNEKCFAGLYGGGDIPQQEMPKVDTSRKCFDCPSVSGQMGARSTDSSFKTTPYLNTTAQNSSISPNSTPLFQQPTLQAQLSSLLERACQSNIVRQRILAFTSAALLSALNPDSLTQTSTSAREEEGLIQNTSLKNLLLSQLTDLFTSNHTTPDRTKVDSLEKWDQSAFSTNFIPSSTDNTASHSPPSFRAQQSNERSFLEHEAVETRNVCQYCHPPCMFPDLLSFRTHLVVAHSPSHLQPQTLFKSVLSQPNRQPYDLNSSSQHRNEVPHSFVHSPKATVASDLNKLKTQVCSAASDSISTQKSFSQRNIPLHPVSKTSNLVACNLCDRVFSSFTACRVHHTKSHQAGFKTLKQGLKTKHRSRGSQRP